MVILQVHSFSFKSFQWNEYHCFLCTANSEYLDRFFFQLTRKLQIKTRKNTFLSNKEILLIFANENHLVHLTQKCNLSFVLTA